MNDADLKIILKRQDQRQASLEKALLDVANRPSARAVSPPGVMFSSSPFHQGSSQDWPVDKLERLKPYDHAAVAMLSNRKGQNRISGIGPYLCKMAGLAATSGQYHADTVNRLKDQGLWDDNYTSTHFTKEFETYPASLPYKAKSWGGGQVLKAALAEGSGQTGGYVIPPQFMNELLTIAAEDGFIEQRCKVIPMNTRTVEWPMLDITTAQAVGTSPYFGGILATWQPEAATISETEPAFRQTTWTAWDLVLYTVSSNQLLADNGIGLDALLTQLFGAAITWYKEYAYLQGKGAGSTMPLGILNSPALISQTRANASHFGITDAAAMLSKLQIRSWDDSAWVMHQSVIPELIQMNDIGTSLPGSAGQHLLWVTPYGDQTKGPLAMKLPQAFLNGLPIFFTEKLPKLGTTGCVLLADFSRYVVGMRLDIQIDVSPHYLFRNNQLAWRVIARVDGRPWLNSAITDAAGWSVSPFITVTQ